MLNEDSSLQVTTWDKLRKKYKLKINDTDVKKSYKQTIKDAKDKKTDSAEDTTEDTEETEKED